MADKKESIEAGIKAHFAWFDRLKKVIETGKSEFKPEIVRLDNKCDFGKWIYSELQAICDENTFLAVKETHAEFHKKAAELLVRALEGKDKTKLLTEVSVSSELGRLSGKLLMMLRKL